MKIDELLIAVVTFMCFLSVDIVRKYWRQKAELEKVKIFKAMLASTHHILNNFLNQMQLFKLTAEETPNFDQDVLRLYDEIMESATNQIKILSEIDEISESSIHAAASPK